MNDGGSIRRRSIETAAVYPEEAAVVPVQAVQARVKGNH
jgi:hypothetical protein